MVDPAGQAVQGATELFSDLTRLETKVDGLASQLQTIGEQLGHLTAAIAALPPSGGIGAILPGLGQVAGLDPHANAILGGVSGLLGLLSAFGALVGAQPKKAA
jgi:hypothetical protein